VNHPGFGRSSQVGKDGESSRFNNETSAVRLVKDHVGDYESEWVVISLVFSS
jgi:hypothetical protein